MCGTGGPPPRCRVEIATRHHNTKTFTFLRRDVHTTGVGAAQLQVPAGASAKSSIQPTLGAPQLRHASARRSQILVARARVQAVMLRTQRAKRSCLRLWCVYRKAIKRRVSHPRDGHPHKVNTGCGDLQRIWMVRCKPESLSDISTVSISGQDHGTKTPRNWHHTSRCQPCESVMVMPRKLSLPRLARGTEDG